VDSRLRRAEEADAAALRDIYAPFVADSATSFEDVPPDTAAMAARIRDLRDLPWLVFEEPAGVTGYAYAAPHRAGRRAYRWCVETSVYIAAGARRRGVGRALYGALFELLRRQGYVNAYAGITLPNPASLGLHAAMGFEPVGVYPRIGFKLGRWHDVAWMRLRLQDPPVPVDEPLPASRLFDDPAVEACLRRASPRGGA